MKERARIFDLKLKVSSFEENPSIDIERKLIECLNLIFEILWKFESSSYILDRFERKWFRSYVKLVLKFHKVFETQKVDIWEIDSVYDRIADKEGKMFVSATDLLKEYLWALVVSSIYLNVPLDLNNLDDIRRGECWDYVELKTFKSQLERVVRDILKNDGIEIKIYYELYRVIDSIKSISLSLSGKEGVIHFFDYDNRCLPIRVLGTKDVIMKQMSLIDKELHVCCKTTDPYYPIIHLQDTLLELSRRVTLSLLGKSDLPKTQKIEITKEIVSLMRFSEKKVISNHPKKSFFEIHRPFLVYNGVFEMFKSIRFIPISFLEDLLTRLREAPNDLSELDLRYLYDARGDDGKTLIGKIKWLSRCKMENLIKSSDSLLLLFKHFNINYEENEKFI